MGGPVEEKIWLTLRQIADLLGVKFEKVRQTVKVLRTGGEITVRVNPKDNRVIWVHSSGLPLIRRSLGLDDEADTPNGHHP